MNQIKKRAIKCVGALPFSHQLSFLRKYGCNYFWYRFLCNRHEKYSLRMIQNYQFKKLIPLLKHSSSNVPYYQEYFRKNNLSYKDFTCLNDLKKLPIVNKSTIRHNQKKFEARNINKFDPVSEGTSGSTGEPFRFNIDWNVVCMYDAFHWRKHKWAGYHYNDRHAMLRMPIGYHRRDIDKDNFYFYEPITRMLEFNTLYFSEEHMMRIYELMKKYRITVLASYPSMLCPLGKFLKKENLQLDLKVILSTAEMLYPEQREFIENAFQTKVFSDYGMYERALFACQCKHGNYHVNFDSGIIEIVKDGQTCDYDEVGEIVITGLHHRAMPFIRFAMGDYGSIRKEPCSCGRVMPVLDIFGGREKTLVVTSNGLKSICPEMGVITVMEDRVKQVQIYQEKIDEIILRVVKEDSYRDSNTQQLIAFYKDILGEEIKVSVEFWDKLERTPAGKFKYVISTVPY